MRRLALLALAGLAATPPAHAAYDTMLSSRVGLDGAALNKPALLAPAISADGRYIVFSTAAANAPERDPALAHQMYRKDTQTGELTLVSRLDGPDGAAIEGEWPSVSSDGRHVCWIDGADVTWPTAFQGDARVLVRDVEAGRTRAVPGTAYNVDENETRNERHLWCAISKDGNRVAYTTHDAHVPEDTNGVADLYLYDFSTNAWTLASRDQHSVNQERVYWPPSQPAMTPDGRFVAFTSFSDYYGPTDSRQVVGQISHLHIFDSLKGTSDIVDRPPGCDTAPLKPTSTYLEPAGSRSPSISATGRYVAFASDADLDPKAPLPRNLDTQDGTTQDGIFVRDRETCETTLVSRASGPDGEIANMTTNAPSISADGRFVAFSSRSDNLDSFAADKGQVSDIFIRDWKAGRTALVSRTSGVFGAPASGNSVLPALAAGKSRVAFLSQADNLSDEPTTSAQVYHRNILGPNGLLPADLPGEPVAAKPSYRRGRSGRGTLNLDLSEFAKIKVRIIRIKKKPSRGVVLSVHGEEGTNRIDLRRGLARGRYVVRIEATDLGGRQSEQELSLRVRR